MLLRIDQPCPTLPNPVQPCPTLTNPNHTPCPTLSNPFQHCPTLSNPAQPCPTLTLTLSNPVEPCTTLSNTNPNPVQSCRTLTLTLSNPFQHGMPILQTCTSTSTDPATTSTTRSSTCLPIYLCARQQGDGPLSACIFCDLKSGIHTSQSMEPFPSCRAGCMANIHGAPLKWTCCPSAPLTPCAKR